MNKPMKILLLTSATVALLFGVLVVHIQMVTKPAGHLANIQLARIDMAEPVDAATGAIIRSHVAALPGVQHAQYNAGPGNLVYSYDRALQDQPTVLAAVQDMTTVPCTALVVSAEEVASGCPAMAKGGVQDRLGKWIAGFLN